MNEEHPMMDTLAMLAEETRENVTINEYPFSQTNGMDNPRLDRADDIADENDKDQHHTHRHHYKISRIGVESLVWITMITRRQLHITPCESSVAWLLLDRTLVMTIRRTITRATQAR